MQDSRWLVAVGLALVTVLWAVAAALTFFFFIGIASAMGGADSTDTWQWRATLILGVLPLVSAVVVFLSVLFRRRGIARVIFVAGLALSLILASVLLDGVFDLLAGREGFGWQLFILVGVLAPLAATVTMPGRRHPPAQSLPQ